MANKAKAALGTSAAMVALSAGLVGYSSSSSSSSSQAWDDDKTYTLNDVQSPSLNRADRTVADDERHQDGGNAASATFIAKPDPHDVLSGIGRKSASFLGNALFRNDMASHLEEYTKAATNRDKRRVIESMTSKVHQRKGRFLERVVVPAEQAVGGETMEGWKTMDAEAVIDRTQKTISDLIAVARKKPTAAQDWDLSNGSFPRNGDTNVETLERDGTTARQTASSLSPEVKMTSTPTQRLVIATTTSTIPDPLTMPPQEIDSRDGVSSASIDFRPSIAAADIAPSRNEQSQLHIAKLHPSDVVMGHGQHGNLGNGEYRNDVSRYAETYAKAGPDERQLLVEYILTSVHRRGGRFLRPTTPSSQQAVEVCVAFVPMDRKKVTNKIKRALCDWYREYHVTKHGVRRNGSGGSETPTADAQIQTLNAPSVGGHECTPSVDEAATITSTPSVPSGVVNLPLHSSDVHLSEAPVAAGDDPFVTNATVNITKLDPNDVLSGRSRTISSFPGNVLFRKDIAFHLDAFKATTNLQEKSRIVNIIVSNVQNRKGRFLRSIEKSSEEAPDGIWVMMSRKDVHHKTTNAFVHASVRRRGHAAENVKELDPNYVWHGAVNENGDGVHSSESAVNITELDPNDVLSSRLGRNSLGNALFRKDIALHLDAYKATTKREEKNRIIDTIVSNVHGRKGRFLQSIEKSTDEAPDGVWMMMSRTDVHKKTDNAFLHACLGRSGGDAENITELDPNDVLSGIGTTSSSFPGNILFLKDTVVYHDEYMTTTTGEEKSRIIDIIVSNVHSRKGRFLQSIAKPTDEAPAGIWMIRNPIDVRKHTVSALRYAKVRDSLPVAYETAQNQPFETSVTTTASTTLVSPWYRVEDDHGDRVTGNITVLDPNDVLLVLGIASSLFPGNVLFHQDIASHFDAYTAAPLKEKRRLVDVVVSNVRNRKGRFLQSIEKRTDEAPAGVWTILCRKDAYQRTLNAFYRIKARGGLPNGWENADDRPLNAPATAATSASMALLGPSQRVDNKSGVAPYDTSALVNTTKLHPNDVLTGSRNQSQGYSYPGNVHFRNNVAFHLDAYYAATTTKREKWRLLNAVVSRVHSRKGRFLQAIEKPTDEAPDGIWTVMRWKAARTKAMDAFHYLWARESLRTVISPRRRAKNESGDGAAVNITELDPNDVLTWKGPLKHSSPGNVLFGKDVAFHLEAYKAATNDQEKSQIANIIISNVHDRKGRFLRLIERSSYEAPDGIWMMMPPKDAIAKTRKALWKMRAKGTIPR